MWYAIVAAISSLATAVFMVKFIKHNPKLFGVLDAVITKAADYGITVSAKIKS
jgi:hypothetical protein